MLPVPEPAGVVVGNSVVVVDAASGKALENGMAAQVELN